MKKEKLKVYKPIRYDSNLNLRINKTIRNYNQKIARINKYEDSFNYRTPNKITKKMLKDNVYTRRELIRKLNELERFSKRGAENIFQTAGGYIISNYEYENLKRERARVKRIISREMTRLENEKPKVYGKEQVRTYAQMGDTYYTNLKDKREKLEQSIENLKRDEFERFETFVYKAGRNLEYNNSLFRENYKKMLTDLAYYTGYDKERMTFDNEKFKTLKRKRNSEEIFKKLDLQIDDEGNVTINKIKYLEYAIDNIKSGNKFYKLFNEEKSIKTIIEYYLPTTARKGNKPIDPDKIKEDVFVNYNNLIENIDDIIGTL